MGYIQKTSSRLGPSPTLFYEDHRYAEETRLRRGGGSSIEASRARCASARWGLARGRLGNWGGGGVASRPAGRPSIDPRLSDACGRIDGDVADARWESAPGVQSGVLRQDNTDDGLCGGGEEEEEKTRQAYHCQKASPGKRAGLLANLVGRISSYLRGLLPFPLPNSHLQIPHT